MAEPLIRHHEQLSDQNIISLLIHHAYAARNALAGWKLPPLCAVVRAKGEHGTALLKINPDVRDLLLNWDILGLLQVVLRWLLIFTLDEEKCREHGQRKHVRGAHKFLRD